MSDGVIHRMEAEFRCYREAHDNAGAMVIFRDSDDRKIGQLSNAGERSHISSAACGNKICIVRYCTESNGMFLESKGEPQYP